MKEMTINLTMNEEKNIVIKNISNEKFFTILYDNKTITASSIYEMLTYEPNVIYDIESNIDDIVDENDKIYFSDVISLIKAITDEINEMAEIDDNPSNESIENNNLKEELEDKNDELVFE